MNIDEIKVTCVRESAISEEQSKVITPGNVSDIWGHYIKESSWYDAEKEMFVVILLNTQNIIKSYNLVSMGSLDVTIVHPREVFKPALVTSSAAIILSHNHPSGKLDPSFEDVRLTKQLLEGARIFATPILDHVIVAKNGEFFSMREHNTVDFK